ncbi:MAG: septum formation protein Maf [Clostridia bacterium]|nr:septum formation protein Maf [Clostridia bacterium]
MRIVLGSKSPRRKEILGMVTEDFCVRVSDADESYDDSIPLSEVPRLLAKRKAEALELEGDELLICCDTVVILENQLLGKPKTDGEAIEMLRMLSGTTHSVVSGICVRTAEKTVCDSITTYVKMRQLEQREIEGYVYKHHPTDKAGAYGIQESAGAFVEKIDGDFYNVVGLPLCRLTEILKNEFNISLV